MKRNDQSIVLTSRAYRDHYAFWKKQLSFFDESFFFTGGLVNQHEPEPRLKEYRFEFDKES